MSVQLRALRIVAEPAEPSSDELSQYTGKKAKVVLQFHPRYAIFAHHVRDATHAVIGKDHQHPFENGSCHTTESSTPLNIDKVNS